MIDPNVSQIAACFKNEWNPRLSIAPALLLDDTWPSIGTLDLLTFPLRLVSDLPKEAETLLRGSAAYLALVIHKCWSLIADKVDAANMEEGITVTASGGRFLAEDETVRVNVEKTLRDCLENLPYPYPVISAFTRPISFDANVICPLAIGLFTGLSPFVEGPWAKMQSSEYAPALESILRELARQSADNYARVYPDEPLGQVAELYLHSLIFPPLMIGETLPATNSSQKIIEFFDQYKISRESILKLARNLARSADELFCCTGLVLYAALTEEMPPEDVIAAAQAKGKFMGLLRRSVIAVRDNRQLGPDWIESGLTGDSLYQRCSIENALNLIPWLYLSPQRIAADAKQGNLTALLAALCDFDFSTATRVLEKLIEEDPSDIECRLQMAQLRVLAEEYEEAEGLCSNIASEPGADENPRLFDLWGMVALKRRNQTAACKYLKAGLAIKNMDPVLKSDMANNLGWAYILQGDFTTAIRYIDVGLETALCPVTLILNKVFALWRLSKHEEAGALRHRLFAIAPTDRRVFSDLTQLSVSTPTT
ncbi:MAG TPA: hypothetical protein PLP17_00495 [Oligoflexia bacterium]|nr:hypothetical protein [Oligoflexia bacterium]